jgi:spermidine/putrescine-binding protein
MHPMIPRRSLLVAACLAALTAAGCSSGGSGSGGPAPSGAPASGKAGKELVLFGWAEYIPDAVIQGFTKETGITVLSETFSSNEEMLSKMLAGATAYDLVQPSEYMVEALTKQNKLLALDHANLPNLKHIVPEVRGQPHDPTFKFCAPYLAGIVGIAINTEKIKDPIKGYKDVFQEKFKGRIAVLNDARELVSWALASQGIRPNDITEANLEKARPVLAGWLKLVKVFDSDSPKTPFLNGDVDVGVIWSGEAALLHEQNKKFAFVVPEEGTHLYIDHLCIPAGAKNKAGAEMFINHVLRPDVSKIISDKFPYWNPNAEARKLLTDAQRANPASYPAGMFEKGNKIETFRDLGKVSTDIDKLVTDLKAAN